jgi:phage gpG-like protein
MPLEGDDADLRRVIAQLEQLAGGFLRAMTDVADLVVTELVDDEFAGDHGPEGEAWQPNLAGTTLLYQSGDLMASLTPRSELGAVSVVSDLPYAAIHNFGGQAGRDHASTIPARPFLPFDALPAAWEAALDAQASAYLQEMLA